MRRFLIGSLLILLVPSAHAGFVKQDWLVGDQAAVTDTSTGNTWLRAEYTYGLSSAQVLSMTAEGGSLYGWRIATSEEVAGLLGGVWDSLAANPFSTWGTNLSQQAVASDLMRHIEFFDLFGGLYSYPSSRIRVEVKGLLAVN